MINYSEKGVELHKSVAAAGYELEQVCRQDGTKDYTARRMSDGARGAVIDSAVQSLIDSFDYVAALKKNKRQALKDEWLRRVQIRFADIESRSQIKLLLAMWTSCRAAATIHADWQYILDMETAFDNARAAINGLTTVAQVQAYDVITQPAWPA